MKKAEKKQTILLTGGSGLLGVEIRKIAPQIIAPSHAELDITDLESIAAAFKKYRPDTVIHAAAATKPPEHEKHPEIGITANIIGTANVAHMCLMDQIRLIYISTDYVYEGAGPHREEEALNPPSNYAWSKLGGEASVRIVPNSLILRLSFGPVPFPWDKVYENQWNSKLYVDEIAPLVLKAALSNASGVMNVGGSRTTLLEYARRTKPGIESIPKPDWVPTDTSLDIGKMRTVLGIENPLDLLKHK